MAIHSVAKRQHFCNVGNSGIFSPSSLYGDPQCGQKAAFFVTREILVYFHLVARMAIHSVAKRQHVCNVGNSCIFLPSSPYTGDGEASIGIHFCSQSTPSKYVLLLSEVTYPDGPSNGCKPDLTA